MIEFFDWGTGINHKVQFGSNGKKILELMRS
jgi:hypothetical protein